MIRHFQRITQLNPLNGNTVVSHTHRQTPHTLKSLEDFAKQYSAADETSINGRTKAGWINFIEYLGTTDVEDSVDTDAE